jgi:hypothetical protein
MSSKYRRRRHPSRYLTVGEIAGLMGMHPNSILWNIRQGYLRAEIDQNGYRYLILEEDYRLWRSKCYGD